MRVATSMLGIGVALAATLAASAQQTFRASADLVLVDFTAVVNDGHPIADLRKEEITLRIDGQVRNILNAS